MRFHLFAITVLLISVCSITHAEHRILLGGKDGLSLVEPDGTVSWNMPWGGIHDLHITDNGQILTRRGKTGVVKIDAQTKQIAWEYDSAKRSGNEGKRVEVHAFQELPGGNMMIAESGSAKIIEVDTDGKIVHEMPLVTDRPNAHSDTRLVRVLDNGNYLAAQESDGKVREYQRDGTIVWEYEVPMFGKNTAKGHGPEAFGNRLFSAQRLPNGNTLIGAGNGHSVLEVTPEKVIVWQIHQDDLPGIKFAWITTVEVLANGNYVIGNCHAGPEQPILVEIEPKSKTVVWQLDGHEQFGNNVSNSMTVPAGWPSK